MFTKKIILSLFASLALISCGGSNSFEDKKLTFNLSVEGEYSNELFVSEVILKGTPIEEDLLGGKAYVYEMMIEIGKSGNGWKNYSTHKDCRLYNISAEVECFDDKGMPVDVRVSNRGGFLDSPSFPRVDGDKTWIPFRVIAFEADFDKEFEKIKKIEKIVMELRAVYNEYE